MTRNCTFIISFHYLLLNPLQSKDVGQEPIPAANEHLDTGSLQGLMQKKSLNNSEYTVCGSFLEERFPQVRDIVNIRTNYLLERPLLLLLC